MLIHDPRSIGEKLYAIRKRTGKTQLRIATEAGLSDRTYSEFERGVADARLSTVLKACEALHITPDDILTDARTGSDVDEADVLTRLHACSPRDKATALQILDAFLRSLN